MMPVGPLMIEHRLIERMLKAFAGRIEALDNSDEVDIGFVDEVIDFIRSYADRCHHGKEEDIFFRELKKKPLSRELLGLTDDLIYEHNQARQMVAEIITAKEDYMSGNRDARAQVVQLSRQLISFYPDHIEKEDKHYFVPCMAYFDANEQAGMLREFAEFDRSLIHTKYRTLVEKLEKTQA